jgi:hypothetical protein
MPYCHVYLYPFVEKFLAEVLGTIRSSIYQNYTWKHYAWNPCLTCYQNYTWKHLFTNICYIFQSAQNLLGIISYNLVSLFSFDAGVDKFGNITLGLPAGA